MARAALRALQLCPSLQQSWPAEPFQALLFHAHPDVRWCGVEGIALLSKLVRLSISSYFHFAQYCV